MKSKNRIYPVVKRGMDIFFSVALLFLLSLPMCAIALTVAFTSEGGAIFRQRRVGREGREFICYKFRTMYITAPRSCPKARFEDAYKYVTPVGRFLRRTSLDELPQLFNVLLGNMSLVGPRPLVAEEGEIHDLRRRCGVYRVRPGITGLAQISGRDALDDMEKARLDVRYARGVSFSTDARIVLGTLLCGAGR